MKKCDLIVLRDASEAPKEKEKKKKRLRW